MSDATEDFVVKAVPNCGSSTPLWLLVQTKGSAFEFFGPREKARVFPTHAEAVAAVKRWEGLLQPALSLNVERA